MKTLLLLLTICFSLSSFASLPPKYRSINKVKLALEAFADDEDAFGAIQEIKYNNDKGSIFIRTDAPCFTNVELEAEQSDYRTGPTKFIVKKVNTACAQH